MVSLSKRSAFIRRRVMRAPTTSWWWKVTLPSSRMRRVSGLAMSWNSAASRSTTSGPSVVSSAMAFSITASECAHTSLWRWIGSQQAASSSSSGTTHWLSPVSTSSCRPRAGWSEAISLTSSSRIRSAEIVASCSRMAVAAASVSGSGSASSRAANRASRTIRSGSSPKEVCGSMGVRSTRRCRSPSPPKASTNRKSGTFTAIALTVKSRRARSSSSESP